MTVELNHTIVNVRDKNESANFIADIPGLSMPTAYGPFLVVDVANAVSLDFIDVEVLHPHYAFLVSETEFDEIMGRIVARDITYWADPYKKMAAEINTNDGGRGLYWKEPSATCWNSSLAPTAATTESVDTAVRCNGPYS